MYVHLRFDTGTSGTYFITITVHFKGMEKIIVFYPA